MGITFSRLISKCTMKCDQWIAEGSSARTAFWGTARNCVLWPKRDANVMSGNEVNASS
jgi:hypothetical protein